MSEATLSKTTYPRQFYRLGATHGSDKCSSPHKRRYCQHEEEPAAARLDCTMSRQSPTVTSSWPPQPPILADRAHFIGKVISVLHQL
jgi:hypothetical protein